MQLQKKQMHGILTHDYSSNTLSTCDTENQFYKSISLLNPNLPQVTLTMVTGWCHLRVM